MKGLLLSLLLTCPVLAFGQNVKALDQKNGFRDVSFGADSSALAGRIRNKASGGNLGVYNRPTDELKVGAAELFDINYIYYKGKLSDILIHTKGLSNSRALREALEASFGKGYQHNRFMQEFDWSGKVVSMNYDENEVTGNAAVFISSQAISKQKRADDAAAAKAGKNDL